MRKESRLTKKSRDSKLDCEGCVKNQTKQQQRFRKEELYKKVFVPFNLNTTAQADFQMIPGVGKRMAHEFEEYRPYKSVKQFKKEIGKYVDEAEVGRYLNYVFVKT